MTHLPVLPADAEAADGRGAHPTGNGGGAAAQLTGDHQLYEGGGKQASCRWTLEMFGKQTGRNHDYN